MSGLMITCAKAIIMGMIRPVNIPSHMSHVLTLTDSFADFTRQRLLHGFTPKYEASLYS